MFKETEILSPFKDIYDIIAIEQLAYKSFLSKQDKYSDEFKAEQKAKYVAGVKKAIKDAADQVRENIENTKVALTTIEMEQPPTFEGEPRNESEQLSRQIAMLQYEMKKQNDFNIFQYRINNSKNATELEELYNENKTNPTFKLLFDTELQKRSNDSSLGTEFLSLQHKLTAEPEEFSVLKKIESALSFSENEEVEYIPTGIENGLEQTKLTSIWDGIKDE